MDILKTYLSSLQSKTFKLLPMREALDSGINNHLDQYLDNLCANCAGAFECHPELANITEVVEAYNNLMFLKCHQTINFKSWRATVLRSTRLISTAISKYFEEV